jgi:hypothetical protein
VSPREFRRKVEKGLALPESRLRMLRVLRQHLWD